MLSTGQWKRATALSVLALAGMVLCTTTSAFVPNQPCHPPECNRTWQEMDGTKLSGTVRCHSVQNCKFVDADEKVLVDLKAISTKGKKAPK